jgi:RND family efflux transporter MFP subunit
MNSRTFTLTAAVALAFGLFVSCSQAQSSQQLTVTGITKPSVHAKRGLNQFGIVLEIPVKDGQIVKKGDLLLRQDDRQEQAALESLQLEANSDVEIKATEADLKVKEVQLKRIQQLVSNKNASPLELEEAEVKVVYARAQVDLAKLKQDTKKLDAKRQGFKVEQMRIVSEFDGKVENIDVSVGEVTDPQKPVMTVVQLNPLWVEFYLPINQAQKVQVGQSMDVRYADAPDWMPTKVILRAPVADAAAGMQKLRLELPNPNLVDAGQQLVVKLPPELSAPAAAAPAAAAIPAP